MPDEIFANARLAQIYDHVEGERADLVHYLALVDELGASSVLDVGCGTGTFATMLAERGLTVTGVDPAAASLDVAIRKPFAERVDWLLGDATALPALGADMAVMTGNVAQVFTTDEGWAATLAGIKRTLDSSGHLVFETRDPSKRAWEGWTKDHSTKRLEIPAIGVIVTWHELSEVTLPLVRFETTVHFEDGGQTFRSDSTLRFRELDELERTLAEAGFAIQEVRDAPDRPGKEWVVIARVANEDSSDN